MTEGTDIHNAAYSFLPTDRKEFNSLAELALDLRWSWDHSADEVWRQLDPVLWDTTHSPWIVLQTVSRDHFNDLMSDPYFQVKVDVLLQYREESHVAPAWFQQNFPDSLLTCVAYFSMEFMLSEALPIYSGGLGNVAGDQLKTASDLGVPVVGIGLLYQQGYFRQAIDKEGGQEALFPYNDPGQLPVTPLRLPNGEWLRLEINLPGYDVWLRVWQVQVGRIKLYLLDSNDAANFPVHRGITGELYGGSPELRLKQELVLGIGGWRLLRALDIQPQICHLNEGHAAFAILERAGSFMADTGQSFEVALTATRAGNLFTTHTAVPAGFDSFPPALISQYLGEYAEQKLGIKISQLLALGRHDSSDESENFNMAYLAIHGSGAVNGVSRLHGEVSRHIVEPLFPNWPVDEVPVGHITNGVHMPTWDSREADEIWTECCGKDRWLGTNKNLERDIRRVSDERLWEMRLNANKALLKFAGEQLSRQLLGSGHSSEAVEHAKHLFDPHVLTLGFARRFATYKRPNLLLRDPQRLMRLLTNPACPVQLIISGKAHPADQQGQDLIREWIRFIRQSPSRPPVIFLSDYDMQISENLVQGVDVWINTPQRPWEASGTSGMKVLVNGGINLSELDGWWAEAYTPEVGWAIGDGKEHDDTEAWDAAEAEQLYTILEQQVVPEFYNRNGTGIPTAWVFRMRESMAQLTPFFSADRTVREYTKQHYLPATKAFLERTANNGERAKLLSDTIHSLDQKWDTMRFGEVTIRTVENQHLFDVEVYFNEVNPEYVLVELFSNGAGVEAQIIQVMQRGEDLGPSSNAFLYQAAVSAHRQASDFTPRIIPCIPSVSVPLEINRIIWQH
ncbi:MAG: alpha-glucan family phosphorylase [Bacteroidota bacterium]|nr:alpha-glucan family phosphorylase [Bacteroidota bacterium]